jgi:hypothetical protein
MKKNKKPVYSKIRNFWPEGVHPATKIIPSKKLYKRSKAKKEIKEET